MKISNQSQTGSNLYFSPQRNVFLFSLFFFLIITVVGSAAIMFTMRQIIRKDIFQQLSRIIETRNLQFNSAFDSQIKLAVNMAESPLIRSHLSNPGDTQLARQAFAEFNTNRKFFSGNNIFWISDIDKRYFFNDEYSYTLDTANPDSSWYSPTLNQKERYSFNVNYDIGIKRTLCWINVPVYDDKQKPIGIVGTGIDLTDYINILFSRLDKDTTLYIFNNNGEITGAKDTSLMERKALISEVWESGPQVFLEAKSSSGVTSKAFFIGGNAYALSPIQQLNWYIAVSKPITIIMFFNNAMFVFLALMVVILLIFIIFNIYISNILKPVSIMLERMRSLSMELKKSSQRVRYRQILLVCFAFILMIVISFAATNIIMRNQLAREAEELLSTAELTIASNLRESVTTLVESAFTIEYLVRRGENQNSIHSYMVDISKWLFENEDMIYGFTGLYGYIRDDFLDGAYWEPPPDYMPQERPWFIVAKEKAGEYADTIPYVDAHTGEIVISYSKELFDDSKKSLGVLAIDVLLNQMGEYVENLRKTESGYGILLNQNFEIMAHPNATLKGRQLESINKDFANVQTLLKDGKPVSALRLYNFENIEHIVFFKKLYNGWYICSMMPVRAFYKEMYVMVFILTLVGSVLMFMLSILISRQHRSIENYTDAVIQLNEASRRFIPSQFVKILGVENITRLKLGDSVQSVITVMFFDIRYFSVHSQMMSTNQTFDFVNKVLGIAGTIIQKHNGFVDKYLGDAAMVLFEHAHDAVRAGIEIYRALILDETTRITSGMDGINIGIGVHTGNVMMGVIGDKEHYSSTVISKHVNTASRIEGLTKQVKAGMLISADVMQEIPENELDFNFRYLGLINPALSRETIGIFEILDILPDDTWKRRLETKEYFESAIRNFHTENYSVSAERFMKVIEIDSTDDCAKLFYKEAMACIDGLEKRSVFSFNVK